MDSFSRFWSHRIVHRVTAAACTSTEVADRRVRWGKPVLPPDVPLTQQGIDAGRVDTQNDLRDADLRRADFFNTDAFPTIDYRATGLRRVGEKWVVEGTLTIREIARAVPLELVYKGTAPPRPGEPSRIAFYATAAVKRADFGMTRGLLDEIGVVSDKPDVWIEIDAEFQAEGSSEKEGGVDGSGKASISDVYIDPDALDRWAESTWLIRARSFLIRAMAAPKSNFTPGGIWTPNSPAFRTSAQAREARRIPFDGTQPTFKQSPPIKWRSMSATFAPLRQRSRPSPDPRCRPR